MPSYEVELFSGQLGNDLVAITNEDGFEVIKRRHELTWGENIYIWGKECFVKRDALSNVQRPSNNPRTKPKNKETTKTPYVIIKRDGSLRVTTEPSDDCDVCVKLNARLKIKEDVQHPVDNGTSSHDGTSSDDGPSSNDGTSSDEGPSGEGIFGTTLNYIKKFIW